MGTRITTLNSGLRVVTEDSANALTSAIGIWVDVGARHERLEQNGISHLIEHMAFKGTERRDARAIAEEIEAVGGHLNAYTSREHTAFYARVLAEDVPLAVDMLSDILQHSTFEEQELVRERQVIVQEIGQAQDTPDDLVFEMLQEAAHPDQPMGRSILGTVERVEGFQRGDLNAYMAEHYRAPAMVIAGAGRVDHDALVDMARTRFDALGPASGFAPEPSRHVGGEARDVRDFEQAHLAIGFPGLAYDDPDFYAYQVYSTVLGGGMSSRLFQEVREKRGLAYSVFSFASSYHDGGMLGIYAGTGDESVADLVPVIADEMLDVSVHATEEEVARGRAQMKAGLLMSLESSSSRAEQLARHMLIHGRVIPTPELIASIDAVDAAAVRRVARRILDQGAPAIAALGPVAGLPAHDRILERFRT
ncbi:M16 family metallopeptidase [Zavarzinia sp. CC-PAN008]|uniref:M16 family metallopeptidase n=1 Tax=Zavarzinia sp. CC-PAN008 TaxID=3243332 RepID=UPI003F74A8E8